MLNPVKLSAAKERTKSPPLFLAGDLALDFINTRIRVGGEVVDCLQTDEDVLGWLEKAGLSASKIDPNTSPLLFLRAARVLRENIRSLVEKRKTGHRGNPSVLNNFLKQVQSHPRLVWNKPHSLTIERIRQEDGPEAILAPVAEAAAVLLTTADFELVKRCEERPACYGSSIRPNRTIAAGAATKYVGTTTRSPPIENAAVLKALPVYRQNGRPSSIQEMSGPT